MAESARAGGVAPSGLARRLALLAATLVTVPLLVEAATLDPREFAAYREPAFAAIRMVVAAALPYLAVAVSTAALALFVQGRGVDVTEATGSRALAVLAVGIGVAAAVTAPSTRQTLLNADVRLSDLGVQLGGALAPAMDPQPIPLEDAGTLAELLLPAQEAPGPVTVRWIAARTQGEMPEGTRVELVASGQSRDLTGDYAALRPGEVALFTRVMRVGPGSTQVRLRLARDPVPPVVFLDAGRSLDLAGSAIDAGGGDRAFRVDPRTGPGAPTFPTLRVEGEHRTGGHAVMVVSGDAWGVHDLAALRRAGGSLQIRLANDDDVDWRVRLVGDAGAESPAVRLAEFTPAIGEQGTNYGLGLDRFEGGSLDWAAVVGVALLREGPEGAFALDLAEVRAAMPEGGRSGCALATTGALDPGARPSKALLTAGTPTGEQAGARTIALRAGAAGLALLAALGLRGAARLLVAMPIGLPLALLSGPAIAAVLGPLLQRAADPRIEQVPVALAVLALSGAVLVLTPTRADAPEGAAPLAQVAPEWLQAALGLSTLGIIAVHVTADASGQPWAEHPESARVLPALLRAVATGFDTPLLLMAALYTLASRLHARTQPWGDVVLAAARRLLPPLLALSAVYLLVRHGKAIAFGYEDAYRRELAEGAAWLQYALLGNAQYHLYYLPLVLGLLCLYPLYQPAHRRPALGLLVGLTLGAWPYADAWVAESVATPQWRAYVLRATMSAAFLGYGLAAFALHACRADPRRRSMAQGLAVLVIPLALTVLVRDALLVAAGGAWVAADLPTHLARFLLPVAIFAAFAMSPERNWPAPLREVGRLALPVYLLHPAILDVLEVVERGRGLGPTTTVALNFGVVAGVSLALAALARQAPPLRSLVGLRR